LQKMTLLAVLSGLSTKILKGLNATLTLKLVRRQMYGRGKIDLLQARLIGAE